MSMYEMVTGLSIAVNTALRRSFHERAFPDPTLKIPFTDGFCKNHHIMSQQSFT